MRAYDNGSFFTVSYSAADASEFRSQWPGSSVRGAGSWEFDKRNGDLVGANGSAAEGDGSDWLAFSEDCQKYGEKALAAKRKRKGAKKVANPAKRTAAHPKIGLFSKTQRGWKYRTSTTKFATLTAAKNDYLRRHPRSLASYVRAQFIVARAQPRRPTRKAMR